MEIREITDVARAFIAAKINSYLHPSAGRVKAARKKVEKAKKDLETAEDNLKKVQEEWLSFKKETLRQLQENRSALHRVRMDMRRARSKAKAAEFKKKAAVLLRRTRMMRFVVGHDHRTKAKLRELKSAIKHGMQGIGDLWNSIMKTTVG